MRERVLVIGLDSADFTILNSWISKGLLPNLSRLLAEGCSSRLISTLPLGTPAAWSSIITGKNPGKHGLYDFMMRRDGSYEIVASNSTFRQSEDLWEIVSRHGKRSCVVNVPFTYPPRRVNGVMISGIGLNIPRSAKDITYPKNLLEDLEKNIGSHKVHMNEVIREGREEIFLKDAYETTESVVKAARYLIDRVDWDLFMVVFWEADPIAHSFWEYFDQKHPRYTIEKERRYGDALRRYYMRIDEIIKELTDRIDENTTIFVISDHGLRPLYRWIHVNNLLNSFGYLKFKNGPLTLLKRLLYLLSMTPLNLYRVIMKLGIQWIRARQDRIKKHNWLEHLFLSMSDIDWSRTKAYFIPGFGQVYLNVRGREPLGVVDPGEDYQRTRQQIIEALSEFIDPDTGTRVFQKVYKMEEIYHGANTHTPPDILLLPNSPYNVIPEYGFPSNSVLEDAFGTSAMHNLEGILIMKGPHIKPQARLGSPTVVDVAPTILYALNLPIPPDIDGRVLEEAFETSYLSLNPIKFEKEVYNKEQINYFSKEEEEVIKDRLRSIGYLD